MSEVDTKASTGSQAEPAEEGSAINTRQRLSLPPLITILLILIFLGIAAHAYLIRQELLVIRNDLSQMKAYTEADWEYEVVTIAGEGYDRVGGLEAFYVDFLEPSVETLNEMGNEGWELSTCYLELETAFPNFGDEDYVTGIRDNIRPQRLVLIFKRRLS